MKKITAFFMALMPLLVTILLFAAGLIVKNQTHIYVSSVELAHDSLVVQKSDETKEKTFALEARVLPVNATNPELKWISSDEKVLTVDNKGTVSCKNFGEAYVYAVSKENQTISSSCKVEVNDKEIHNVIVSDEDKYDVAYVGLNERKNIKTKTVPSTGVVDPTLVYEVEDGSKEYVDVTQDGLILPKKQTEKKKATIKIHPATGQYKSRVTTVEVQIGPGVEQLCLKDQTESITSSQTYNVFNQLSTYPETNVSATDFEYKSNNEDIATIDENGVATFKKNEQATFSATYKRNPKLSVKKTVSSTCDSILNINFNCAEYEQNIEYKDGAYTAKYLDSEKFICDVYPQVTSNTKYNIISSDKNVVLPERQSDGSYKFKALRPGCVMLYAYVDIDGYEKVADACCVTVTGLTNYKDDGLVKTDTINLSKGMFYYPLINSLNLQDDKRTPYDISYEIASGSDIATIDDNGILHFTSAGKVEVTVKLGKLGLQSTGTITVVSTDMTTDIEAKNQLVINVGQKYKFTNVTPIFTSKSYEKYFDVKDDCFIAKQGCNIQEFEVKLNDGTTRNIHLIVKEDPVYIKNSKEVFFTTEETEYNYKQEGTISIVPSTATKDDGSSYSLNYTYQLSNNSIKVEDDKITFSDKGIVQVTTTCNAYPLTLKSWFKSTNGKLVNFALKDSKDKEVKSNSDVTYAGTDLVYRVSGLAYEQAEAINATSLGKLFEVKKEIIEDSYLFDRYTAQFTITPKSTLYGKETVTFSNGSYTIYLNVELPATVTAIDVKYGRETLDASQETITSFVQTLTLDIIPYPGFIEAGAYTAKLNDKELTVTNNQVTVDLTQRAELKIYAKGSSTPLKTYKFNYETDWSKLRISMIGADKDNNLYMGSKETKKVLYLKANGLVSKDFFETDEFKVELDGTHSEESVVQQDILTISNLPTPDGKEYSLGMTLKYDTYKLGQFKLTRDTVSKVVLPKHDNDDMTDKKGLQKVHVYGNKSYYDDKEKQIEGYRIPIEVYDYKGDLIVNTPQQPDAKAKAIKSLNLTIDKNCSATYDEKYDCVLVKFAKDVLYDESEIAQDLFDAKDGAKNVTFAASTKSNIANAKYTFVAVDGTNVYCQEGIANADGNKPHGDGTIVLQTNFGASSIEKENVKFEINPSWLGGIYGNGYTMGMSYQTEHTLSSFYLGFHFSFNTIFEGCSDQIYAKMASNTGHNIILRNMDHYKKGYFMYSVYRNFGNGIGYTLERDPQAPIIKNSVFYNNKFTSLIANADVSDVYIENCLFFDCGGLPSTLANGAMHFKGYVGIYNFHNKEGFKDVFGYDLSSLWPIAEDAAKRANMTQEGYDHRLYINFFMSSVLTDKFYFWNSKTQQYDQGVAGTPDAANFLAKFIDLKIPFTSINASMWATYNKTVNPASFGYYDEFDENGNKRLDFLSNQITKLSRKPIYF